MTEKRLFVGKKKCEDRFTIIANNGEIGVKENRSGDVLVLKHSDLNAQQFVAQLVVFLNDQNQAIVDLYDGSKYWSDKATEKIKELKEENEQLKIDIGILKDNHEIDREIIDDLQEYVKKLEKEKKELKDKNSQLQETLAFRSNQLALMERLVDDLGNEEMDRQMEEILND